MRVSGVFLAGDSSLYAIDKCGWLSGARRLATPNCSPRPPGEAVSLLVIHSISLPPGSYGGGYIERFFCNALEAGEHPYFATIAQLQVSAHFLIARSGELTQFVSCLERAWHAGKSRFGGRENCNDFSIGIELEGTDTDAYTDHQYRALAAVTRALMAAFPQLGAGSIVGHSDIAPQRKTDPGAGFDWHRYRASLAQTVTEKHKSGL